MVRSLNRVLKPSIGARSLDRDDQADPNSGGPVDPERWPLARGRSRRAVVAVAMVASMLVCGCGGLWALLSLSRDDAGPTRAACAVPTGDTYGYCDRLDELNRGRKALSAEQWAAASAVARSIREALASAPADATPRDVTRILRDAGYPEAVVRTAREIDPAPPGAVAYAVRAGSACVIGYRQGTASGSIPAGTLPGDTCLLP
ncbi:hypothetical protein WEI85_08750 [Actinomycetes bacterium KLBMP 9797]